VAQLVKLPVFMEPESVSYSSQKPSTWPHSSRVNSVQFLTTYFFNIHCNIILPPTSRSLKCPFPSDLSIKILCAFLISRMLHALPFHPPRVHRPTAYVVRTAIITFTQTAALSSDKTVPYVYIFLQSICDVYLSDRQSARWYKFSIWFLLHSETPDPWKTKT
jgi:hypothetical protein